MRRQRRRRRLDRPLAVFGAFQIFGETSWLSPIASIVAVFTAMFIGDDAHRRE